MMDLLNYQAIYEVPGAPGLRVGVSDTGQVDLEIAAELATVGDVSALVAALGLAKAQQDQIHQERRPPEPEGLGPNQVGIMRTLAGVSQASTRDKFYERPYPGGGWIWDTDSATRRLLNSLVRRKLVAKDGDHRYRLTEAGHAFMATHVPRYEERRSRS
jgi:hypothetical protein